MWSSLFKVVKDWLKYLWQVVNDAFWWLIETCRLYLKEILLWLLDQLPDAMDPIADTLKAAFYIADYWIALGDIITWLFAYWTFVLTFSLVKIVIKLIPTIG